MVWTSANGPKCPVSPEDRDEFMEPRDVRAATIEECAKIVEPKGPRPCDCERCYCGNIGDIEAVAAWDADTSHAKAIRALALPSTSQTLALMDAEKAKARNAVIEECAKIAADFAAYEQTVLDRAHADDALSDTGRKSIVAAAGSRQVAAEQIEHDIRALLVSRPDRETPKGYWTDGGKTWEGQ